MRPPPEVVEYYTRFAEESRLTLGYSQLEFERTKDLISRFLPQPPAEIVDVGGAAGAYAFWLAELGGMSFSMWRDCWRRSRRFSV